MFDNYVWSDGKIENGLQVRGKTGFAVKTLITYYRSIPLSMLHDLQLIVDGQPIDREKLMFSPDGSEWFTLNEMSTMPATKWEYGDEGLVFGEVEGGLTPGEHTITLKVVIRTAYIPVPVGGERTRTVVI